MKKVLFVFLLLLFFAGRTMAQSDSHISHYVFYPAAFNPAMAGESGMIQVAGVVRYDHMALAFGEEANGVQTLNFGVNTPFATGKSQHGGGVHFVIRTLGSLDWKYQNAYFQYAYKRKTPIGRFSAGLDLGFISSGFDGSKAKTTAPDIPDEDEFHQDNDQRVPRGNASGTNLDINAGIAYFFNGGYAGIALTHLTGPKIELDDDRIQPINRTMYLMGTYQFKIPDTKLVLKPSTLFKTDFVMFEWDVTARLEYNEKLWGGLSYRWGNSIGLSAGLNIVGGLSAGIVYDVPTSNVLDMFGAAELFLEYNFEYVFNKHKKKYKSIRIL